MKKVKALVFSPDPFNPLHYIEDIRESFEVRHILCILKSCKKIEDVLEIAEEEYLDLQEVIKAVERVTSDEATEIANRTDATTFEQSTRHSTKRKKRRPNDDFFYYE